MKVFALVGKHLGRGWATIKHSLNCLDDELAKLACRQPIRNTYKLS